jgi:hypothetical protein
MSEREPLSGAREDELLAVIADKFSGREAIARAYARLLYPEPRMDADWHKINFLILHRFNERTLKWIKTRAWNLREEVARDAR